MITITFISTGITSFLFFLTAAGVYAAWRKQKASSVYYFLIFLISFGFQQLFFSLGTGPAAKNPLLSNLFWAAAHIFMFLGISYFLRFPVSIRFPRLEKIVFRLTILYSVIGMPILFFSIPQVEPFLLESGVYNWKVPALAGVTIGIFTTVCLLFAFGIFVSGAIRVKEGILRVRSIFLALGVLIFLIGGPMHNFVSTPMLNFMADASLIVGSMFLLLGIFAPKFFDHQRQI